MPLLSVEKVGEYSEVAIWHCIEPLEWAYEQVPLDKKTKNEWKQFHPSRQAELLFMRILMHAAHKTYEVHYEESGKPYINKPLEISITHSGQYILIASSSKPIGIDLEGSAEKCAKVYKKFLHQSEQKNFELGSAKSILWAWCAKEAIYKGVGKLGVLFNEQILLPTFAYRSIQDYGMAILETEHQKFNLFEGVLDKQIWVLAELTEQNEEFSISTTS